MLRLKSLLPSRQTVSSLIGVVCALLAMEIALRPFVAGWNYPAGPIREIRQYAEGVATSHFIPDGLSPYGWRLTGNPFLPNAPEGLILADSHGIAEAIPDNATMASVIEGLSRSSGHPLNVAMYGWYGSAAPTYVAVSNAMLEKWNPQWVAVLLTVDDLKAQPLYGIGDAWYWQMKVKPDCSIELVDVRPPTPTGKWEELRQLIGRSTLALAVRRRSVLIASAGQVAPTSARNESDEKTKDLEADIARVPRASVRALKEAYGSRLVLVYMPYCNVTCTSEPDSVESELLMVCQTEGVRCISMRSAMLSARDQAGQFYRGFHNTKPDEGHLNKVGHQIVAEEIWRIVGPDHQESVMR